MLRFAILILLVSAPCAGLVTPPVVLCEAGLTLDLRLLHYTDADGWQITDTGAAAVVELVDGTYVVKGLPAAVGSDRYQLGLVNPVIGLTIATYSWGARPGERLVWRYDLVLPEQPRIYKEGDSYGAIALEIRSGLTPAIADPTTTVSFRLWDPVGDLIVVADQPAIIADVVVEQATQSYGATLLYELAPGDLDATGRLIGEFRICYGVGGADGCHTLPSDDTLVVLVLPRGGTP